MSTINFLGFPISNMGCRHDAQVAFESIESGKNGLYMACANPHSLVKSKTDLIFKHALETADVLIPDGSGIILAAKLLKLPLTEKVAGNDFFIECNVKAQKKEGIRYFFLGSSEKVLGLITKRLSSQYPSIKICGTYSPPFKDEFSTQDNEEMIVAVNRAKPDILWVGMTAPKQEKWIYINRDRLDVPFIGAIGAVFDFYAGTKQRSSKFWINIGLEWLPRLLKEPRRLWERNFKSTPIFVWWIFMEIFDSCKSKS